MTHGLTGRMVIASGLLAIIVGGAFAAVLLSVTELRGTTDERRQTRDALVAADTLEKQVIDLETGLRGFVITRDESFLEPYSDARAALPGSARAFERLAAGEPVQLARVRRIVRAMNAYVGQYAVPLVDAVRRNDPSVRSVARTVTAKLRVDALREGLNSFREAERTRLRARDADVETAARRATAAAALGIAGSVVLIIVFSGYLTRVIVRPLRRAALMANGLAEGNLSVRMPETDVGEIGALERSFNLMAGSLQASRDELVASRARLLTTGDEARRRVVQDLHDGAQQRLVQTILTLKVAQDAVKRDSESAEALVAEALDQAEQSNTELRELAHGLLPAALTHGGLRAGVKELVGTRPRACRRGRGRRPASDRDRGQRVLRRRRSAHERRQALRRPEGTRHRVGRRPHAAHRRTGRRHRRRPSRRERPARTQRPCGRAGRRAASREPPRRRDPDRRHAAALISVSEDAPRARLRAPATRCARSSPNAGGPHGSRRCPPPRAPTAGSGSRAATRGRCPRWA